jgi:hypothetical protein
LRKSIAALSATPLIFARPIAPIARMISHDESNCHHLNPWRALWQTLLMLHVTCCIKQIRTSPI